MAPTGRPAIVTIEPHGSGTRYVATALHRDEDGGQRHEQMGLFEGCGEALEQLVEVAKTS